jgi:hypothetical protein
MNYSITETTSLLGNITKNTLFTTWINLTISYLTNQIHISGQKNEIPSSFLKLQSLKDSHIYLFKGTV